MRANHPGEGLHRVTLSIGRLGDTKKSESTQNLNSMFTPSAKYL